MNFRRYHYLFLALALTCTQPVFADQSDYKALIDSPSEKTMGVELKKAVDIFTGNEVKQDVEKGLSMLEELGKSGDSHAQFLLALIYRRGSCGVAVNRDKALEWMIKAADNGFSEAQAILASFYWTDAEHNDKQKAVELARKAAESGNPKGQCLLGLVYMSGCPDKNPEKVIEKDGEKTVYWLEKSAEQGLPTACGLLAAIYYEGIPGVKRDFEKSVKYAKAGEKSDDAPSVSVLAKAYYTGSGVEKNTGKAIQYFKRAALSESPTASSEACYILALIYSNGEGVPVNNEEAFLWASKGHDKGSISATSVLGDLYAKGKGVKFNSEKAVELWKAAALQGNTRAINSLALAYLKGLGVEKNPERGVELFKKLASMKPVNAIMTIGGQDEYSSSSGSLATRPDILGSFNLGCIYRDGIGVEQDYKESLKWFKVASEKGHPMSTCNVGAYYMNGWGTEKDYDKAFEYTKKAADQGFAVAQYNLATVYELGLGVEKNREKSLFWLEKAADNGHTRSQRAMGEYLLTGMYGIKKNPEKAFKYFTLASEKGDLFARKSLGICHLRGYGVKPDSEKAISIFKELIKKPYEPSKNPRKAVFYYDDSRTFERVEIDEYRPDALAAFNLGIIYRTGDGVKQDYEKAIECFERAIKSGHMLARANLGEMLIKGKGTAVDLKRGIKLTKMAAESGISYAQYNMYLSYLCGLGNEKDSEKAYAWLKRSADSGFPKAQRELGEAYLLEKTTAPEKDSAFKYLSKAAKNGDEIAFLEVGDCYLEGIGGVEQDKSKAVDIYKEIAGKPFTASTEPRSVNMQQKTSKGVLKYVIRDYTPDAVAACNLGLMYRDGDGVAVDYSESVKYLERAAKRGNTLAETVLGSYYLRGKGGLKADPDKAVELIRRAAKSGINEAQFLLGVMYEGGSGVEKDLETALEWVNKAREGGHEAAKEAISRIEQKLKEKAPEQEKDHGQEQEKKQKKE